MFGDTFQYFCNPNARIRYADKGSLFVRVCVAIFLISDIVDLVVTLDTVGILSVQESKASQITQVWDVSVLGSSESAEVIRIVMML